MLDIIFLSEYSEYVKIVYRLVIKDFIGPFFLACAIMTGVLLLDKIFLLVDLLVRKGVSIVLVGELMFYSLPFVLSFCIPIGILIASVMVFGRLEHDNELTAIRSAGVNPIRLFVPLIIFTSAMTVLMVFFNGYILPEANHKARNLITDIAQKKPAVRINERVFLEDFPGYTLYIGSIDERTGKIMDVTIWERREGNAPPALIKSKTGRITTSPDERYFIINLEAGEISELINPDKYRHLTFSEHQINLPIDVELIRRERKYRSDREMVMAELYHKVTNIKHDISSITDEIKKLKSNPDNEVNKYRIDDAETKLRYKKHEFNQYATEIEKKYALGFSCFIFLFFGAGLGIIIRRGGLGFGFIIGLLFFAVYYILMIAGEEFSDAGRLNPFIAIWFANLLLIPISFELLHYVGFEYLFFKKIFKRAK
jgi:lipopolysaccharide export system permease protein